jgi:hypothetical protein
VVFELVFKKQMKNNTQNVDIHTRKGLKSCTVHFYAFHNGITAQCISVE